MSGREVEGDKLAGMKWEAYVDGMLTCPACHCLVHPRWKKPHAHRCPVVTQQMLAADSEAP